MLKNLTELHHAMLSIMQANPEASPAWYKSDAEYQSLIKLLHVYHDAERAAPDYGWIGVGCITFADRALQAAQLPDDPRAHFVAGV